MVSIKFDCHKVDNLKLDYKHHMEKTKADMKKAVLKVFMSKVEEAKSQNLINMKVESILEDLSSGLLEFMMDPND